MIVSIYISEHEYLIDKPQTLNFGGKYLYSYQYASKDDLIVHRKLNPDYIPDFFQLSDSNCKVKLLSAIVGQNGAGKSSILDVIRGTFVEHVYSMPQSKSTILVEVDGEAKVLRSYYENIHLSYEQDGEEEYKTIEKIEEREYQSIYYSPHFDLKYNNNFSEVDKYDITLDQYIKSDLESAEKKGTNENGWRFGLHDELLFKNSLRQIDFLNSKFYSENDSLKEVFNITNYKSGVLHFRNIEIPTFYNISIELSSFLEKVISRIEDESSVWHVYRDNLKGTDENKKQALVNKYLLERFVIKSFLSVIIYQMEKKNTYLSEGGIKNPFDEESYKDFSSKDFFLYFIRESYIKRGEVKDKIFDYKIIESFLKKLNELFDKQTNPNLIKKQSIEVELQELKEVFILHKKIMLNLFNYYPTYDGLKSKSDYVDGFLSIQPSDKKMSSGQNAMLNFFSKFYDFVENNLTENSKVLISKKNYVILLDEADLGFHPVWKKKFVNSILKTIPYFFEGLEEIPNIQIILTTHDPLTLSDLPSHNVIFLNEIDNYSYIFSNNGETKIKKTFGANITDLLADSFFVEDGLIGDFAREKIDKTIAWLNNEERDVEDRELHEKVINLVQEPILKMKLQEMYEEIFMTDLQKEYKIERIKELAEKYGIDINIDE